MKRILDRPVIRAVLTLPDGTELTRDWRMDEAASADWIMDGPPEWLENPSRAWPHPQDPVTFKGTVREGYEDEARRVMGVTQPEANR